MLFQAPVHAENAHFIGKKGTTPYVTHFIFRPLQSLEIPGVGTAHLLEAVGTTQNLKGEPMLDKMAARCTALNVESGDKKYIDGACALTDKDGDVIFSTFDTRDLDARSETRADAPTKGWTLVEAVRILFSWSWRRWWRTLQKGFARDWRNKRFAHHDLACNYSPSSSAFRR